MASRIRKKSGNKKSSSTKSRRSSETSDTQYIPGEPGPFIPDESEPSMPNAPEPFIPDEPKLQCTNEPEPGYSVVNPIASTTTTSPESLPGLKVSPKASPSTTPKKQKSAKKKFREESSSSKSLLELFTNSLLAATPVLPISVTTHKECTENPFPTRLQGRAVEKTAKQKEEQNQASSAQQKKQNHASFDEQVDFPLISSLSHLYERKPHATDDLNELSLPSLRKTFIANVSSNRFEEILTYFSNDKTEEEMFTYFWNMEENSFLNYEHFDEGKHEYQAIKALTETEKYFKEREFKKSLKCFNVAVLQSNHPPVPKGFGGEFGIMASTFIPERYSRLAASFLVRSQLLFAHCAFEACLRDINYYIMLKPKDIPEKLKKRRIQCVEALSLNKSEDLENLSKKITYAEYLKVFGQCLQTGNGDLLRELFLTPCKSDKIRIFNKKSSTVIKHPFESNPFLPSIISDVFLSHSLEKGRHLLTQRAIRPGEVLAREEGFTTTPMYYNIMKSCYQCYTWYIGLLPCPFCPWVMFCSYDCMIKGLLGDHIKECRSLSSLALIEFYNTDFMVPTLAFKTLLRFGYHRLKTILPELKKEELITSPIQKGFNKKGIYDGTDFRSVYHLTNHKDKLSETEIFWTCSLAFALLRVLERNRNYFVDENGMTFLPSDEDMITTGATLLRLLFILPYNAFETAKWKFCMKVNDIATKAFGAGIFPTLSLINHSCYPTATLYYDGKMMWLRANSFIPLGGEITLDYCKLSNLITQEKRKASLNKYFFSCTCKACLWNWEVSNNLCPLKVACTKCGAGVCLERARVKCRNCSLVYIVTSWSQKQFWRSVKQIRYAKERYYNTVDKLRTKSQLVPENFFATTSYIEILKKYSSMPCKEYFYAQENLERLFYEGF